MIPCIRALILDDERLARRELRALLESQSVLVVGEAADVPQAKALLTELNPDVVFLDIQMPSASGFELLPALHAPCAVVFVTAHEEFALQAFEVDAVDYLLKPLRQDRVAECVHRLHRCLDRRRGGVQVRLELDDAVFLATARQFTPIRVHMIMAIEASDDYTDLTLADGRSVLMSRLLKDWEEKLPLRHFVRIHRSAIVNINHVDRIENWFNGAYRVYLRNREKPLVASRRYAISLREHFL